MVSSRNDEDGGAYAQALETLLQTALPESLTPSSSPADLRLLYFSSQVHSDLPSLLSHEILHSTHSTHSTHSSHSMRSMHSMHSKREEGQRRAEAADRGMCAKGRDGAELEEGSDQDKEKGKDKGKDKGKEKGKEKGKDKGKDKGKEKGKEKDIDIVIDGQNDDKVDGDGGGGGGVGKDDEERGGEGREVRTRRRRKRRARVGARLIVTTFAPISRDVGQLLSERLSAGRRGSSQGEEAGLLVEQVVLHELSSERELVRCVRDFFASGAESTAVAAAAAAAAAAEAEAEVEAEAEARGEEEGAAGVDSGATSTPAASEERRSPDTKNGGLEDVANNDHPDHDGDDDDPNPEKKRETAEVGPGKGAARPCPEGAGRARKADTVTRILLVQCDPLAASLEQLDHARFVCESESARRIAQVSRGRGLPDHHVVFLVHLSRGSRGAHAYRTDFDTRWAHRFVDAVDARDDPSGLPGLSGMLGVPLSAVIASLDLPRLLRGSFRVALARLVYPSERGARDIRRQIEALLSLLADDRFRGALGDRVAALVAADTDGVDWQVMPRGEAAQRELAVAGTFKAALHRRITEALVRATSVVLAHMDRDANLALLEAAVGSGDAGAVDNWLSLFAKSFERMEVFAVTGVSLLPSGSGSGGPGGATGGAAPGHAAGSAGYVTVEVACDGADDAPFQARSPFSFFVNRGVESTRAACEAAATASGAAGAEGACAKQFPMLDLGVPDAPGPERLAEYIHDFAAMHVMPTAAIRRVDMARALSAVLAAAGDGSALERVSQVHARYWSVEVTLRNFVVLADAVPRAAPAILAHLEAAPARVAAGGRVMSDVAAVAAAVDALSPSEASDLSAYDAWTSSYLRARDTIAALLSAEGSASDAEAATVTARWAKVSLLFSLVTEVSHPGNVPAAATVSMWRTAIRAHDLKTHAMLAALVEGVSRLNRTYGSSAAAAAKCPFARRARTFIEGYLFAVMGSPDAAIDLALVADLTHIVAGRVPDSLAAAAALGAKGASAATSKSKSESESPESPESKKSESSRSGEGIAGTGGGSSAADENSSANSGAKRSAGGGGGDASTGAGSAGKTAASVATAASVVVPTENVRVSLLRLLLRQPAPVGPKAISELTAMMERGTVLENAEVAVVYAAVCEGEISAGLEPRCPSETSAAGKSLAEVVASVSRDIPALRGADALVALRDVASIRVALARCAASAAEDPGSIPPDVRADLDVLLMPPGSTAAATTACLRPLRMYTLKHIERAKGVSMVRTALKSDTELGFGACAWVRSWIERASEEDTALTRFLGSSLLPEHNPFILQPFFAESAVALGAAVSAASVECGERPDDGDGSAAERAAVAVGKVMDALVETAGRGSRHLAAAILLGAFHEVFLNRCIDVPAPPRAAADAIAAWAARGSAREWFPAGAVPLLRFLLLPAPAPAPAAASVRRDAPLQLSRNSSIHDILVARVVVHLATVALTCPDAHLFRALATVITEPASVSGAHLGAMPEDLRAALQDVLGGGWYACSCGARFYVDACGRPTEILKCHSCGEKIGGLDHVLLETNTEVTEEDDATPRGYCLRSADLEADLLTTAGHLTPSATRAMRFLNHAAICTALAVPADGAQAEAHVRAMLNDAYVGNRSTVEPRPFFAEHLTNDWTILVKLLDSNDDDLAMSFHQVLFRAAQDTSLYAFPKQRRRRRVRDGEEEEEQGRGVAGADAVAGGNGDHRDDGAAGAGAGAANDGGGAANDGGGAPSAGGGAPSAGGGAPSGGAPAASTAASTASSTAASAAPPPRSAWAVLDHVDAKRSWETRVMDNYLRGILDVTDAVATSQSLADFYTDCGGDEAGGAQFLAELRDRTDTSLTTGPGLYASLFRWRRPFSMELFAREASLAAAEHPLLARFVADEPQLRALRHLPSVVRWLTGLFRIYSRKIDRAAARGITCAEAIRRAPEAERARLQAAFRGYCEAWNQSWRFVERFGCLRIPREFASLEMTASTPITFSLPCEVDEGICALALTQFLVERHNEVASLAGSTFAVSSRLLNAAHVIAYDLDAFHGFLRDRAVEILPGTAEVTFDLRRAEGYVSTIVKRPLINLETRIVQFVGEERSAMAGLSRKVPQEDLDPEDLADILAELSGSNAGAAASEAASAAASSQASSSSSSSSMKNSNDDPASHSPSLASSSNAVGSDAAAAAAAAMSSVSDARRCLETLDTCASFLASTGAMSGLLSGDTGQTLLYDYVRDVLLVSTDGAAAALGGSRTARGKVRLCHLISLRDALEAVVDPDPFRAVLPRYKEAIAGDGAAAEVSDIARRLDLTVLLPSLREFIVSHLVEGHLSPANPLMNVLSYTLTNDGEQYFGDIDWFNDHFDPSWTLAQAVEVYNLLAA